MDYKIAILITTFLRDNLLYKTLQTIIENYHKESIVLIADQGYTSQKKDITIDFYKSQIPLEHFMIPFDSGLAIGRNFLIRKASEKKIPYVLISADSIQFTQLYNFQLIIDFLEVDNKRGIVGFELENSKCSWEYLMEITPKGIQFSYPKEIIQFNKQMFKKVNICRNIFLAKTKTLIGLWDEEMKLAEHELAFLEYKKRDYEVYWTNYLKFKRVSGHNSIEYETYRKRFGDYRKLMQQKIGMNGWIIYPSNHKFTKKNEKK